MTYYADEAVTLYHGDCIEVMQGMANESVDAIVTDPPYGLEFMGREWDSFRVDDPGTMRHRGTRAGDHGETDADRGAFGNIAYGGGKRATTNRCVSCGKRDQFRNEHACGPIAQWRKEIIDPHAAPPTSLAFQEWSRTWALEALRVIKPGGHLLAFGGTRTWHRLACAIEDAGFEVRDSIAWMYGSGFPKSHDVSKAIDKGAGAEREVIGMRSHAAVAHAAEPDTTGSHIWTGRLTSAEGVTDAAKQWQGWGTALKPAFEPIVVARKPLIGTVAANVLAHGTGALNIDDCRIEGDVPSVPQPVFGVANGVTDFGAGVGRNGEMSQASGRWPANVILDESQAENLGDESRFFYTAKASTVERPSIDGSAHPTVKPLDLMRYLVRLVTPLGGTVLEPFAGSGTTLEACIVEGFKCIAIEREADYLPLIVQRVSKPIQVTLL